MPEILQYQTIHFEREEEIEALNYIREQRSSFDITLYGQSGCGKTYLLNRIVSSNLFKNDTIVWCDFQRLQSDINIDLFYNFLIYKMLQSRGAHNRTTDRITKDKTFLCFLENSKYMDSMKNNIKKTIILSLSLIPAIGESLSQVFDIDTINKVSCEYQNNSTIFFDYLKWHNKKGKILFVFDNIQSLPIQVVDSFKNIISEFDEKVSIISSYTLQCEENIERKLVEKFAFFPNSKSYTINYLSKEEFKAVCEATLKIESQLRILSNIDFYYSLVNNGNFREIDELFFQLNCNPETAFEHSPIINGLLSLNEIKKDIIDLTTVFDGGISVDFVKQIISYNHSCTETEITRSINDLKISRYVVIDENNILLSQHGRVSSAAIKSKEISVEEERLLDLISSCKKVFINEVYRDISDADFIFCINSIMEFQLKIDFVKHIGLFEKYIDIIYSAYSYSSVCKFYCRLVEVCPNPEQVVVFLPLRTIIQILDSCQKTSNFELGIESCKKLQNFYNVNSYKAKYLLQTYCYDDAIATISGSLNSFENWSILINALQHKRMDIQCVECVNKLSEYFNLSKYSDVEYYYIILRNTGHLFDFSTAKQNIESAEKFFRSVNNKFATLTCLNNLGIVYLYQSKGVNEQSLSIAKRLFNQSFEGMQELRSNEIYQSAVNLGIVYIYLKDYFSAQRYFELAKKEVPSNLSFDKLKIECNCIICKYLSNKSCAKDCIDELGNMYHQVLSCPDPWLKLLYKFNICILSKDEINLNEYPGDYKKYGLFISAGGDDISDLLMLGPSPHWRY